MTYSITQRFLTAMFVSGASKPAEIIPFLYLGNERDSADLTLLRKLGVSKVTITLSQYIFTNFTCHTVTASLLDRSVDEIPVFDFVVDHEVIIC